MTDHTPETPQPENQRAAADPGWYPGPDGGMHYWDGTKFLDIPAPETSSAPSAPANKNRKVWLISAIVAAVVLVGAITGVVLKTQADQREAERIEQVRIAEEQRIADEEAAAQEAKEKKEQAILESQERAAARAEKRKEEEEANMVKWRTDRVKDIEKSVKKMAASHIDDGLIDGPKVLSVSCTPVSGADLAILDLQTTTFDCFVGTTKHDDGTQSGYHYHAIMNWDTTEYSYGIGRP